MQRYKVPQKNNEISHTKRDTKNNLFIKFITKKQKGLYISFS